MGDWITFPVVATSRLRIRPPVPIGQAPVGVCSISAVANDFRLLSGPWRYVHLILHGSSCQDSLTTDPLANSSSKNLCDLWR